MDFLRKLAAEKKKLAFYLAALVALGALSLMLGRLIRVPAAAPEISESEAYFPSEPEQTDNAGTFVSERAIEERLEEFFALVDGAGRVRVMVSQLTVRETVYAVDTNENRSYTTEQDAQGGNRETRQLQSQEQTVLITDRQGVDRPLVLREAPPRIEGIVIIAEGGECPFVRDALTRAARAVLGLDAHRVQVLTMSK